MPILTSAERAEIFAMRAQARLDAANGTKSYFNIYETLANWLTGRYGVSASDPAVLWCAEPPKPMRGAAQRRR